VRLAGTHVVRQAAEKACVPAHVATHASTNDAATKPVLESTRCADAISGLAALVAGKPRDDHAVSHSCSTFAALLRPSAGVSGVTDFAGERPAVGQMSSPNRCTNARRSTLPMPRIGSASTIWTSRGAAVPSNVAATCARNVSSEGAA
jgi:hypothetical protein